MSPQPVSPAPISRRRFLRLGCLTAAAAWLTVCGVSAVAPDPAPVDLQSFTYEGNTMDKRILVAYASATGSTVDVAAEIGKTLGTGGVHVDVRPIEEELVDGYRAVLIGSAVQHGQWLPKAVDFVQAHRSTLEHVPVALFCVHIRNLENDERSRQNRLAYLDAVRSLLHPVAEGYFAGRFDRRGAALMLPGLLARFVPSLDFRNWREIGAWAESVRPLLHQQT
jgi:menaquinone-dependent protoporphyrinogen oxidase